MPVDPFARVAPRSLPVDPSIREHVIASLCAALAVARHRADPARLRPVASALRAWAGSERADGFAASADAIAIAARFVEEASGPTRRAVPAARPAPKRPTARRRRDATPDLFAMEMGHGG